MLARSTAWRHGVGRSSANATSMSRMWPSRTIRLAGLMSRWARPASHRIRTRWSASSISASSTTASPSSTAPSRNSVTSMYSRSGVSSTKPYDLGPGTPASRNDAQRVVLLLDQPTHGVERLLVLQPPVQQLATELVPAVRAQVGARVQLAEQVRRRRAFHPQAQRRRAGRPAQPDRLGPRTRSGRADRRPPCGSPHRGRRRRRGGRFAPGGTSPGTPRSGRSSGRRSPQSSTPMRTAMTIVARRVDAEMEAGQCDERDDDRDHPLQSIAQPPLRHQRVQGHDRQPGERQHLDRGHRPATPAPSQRDAEGTGLGGQVVQ